MGFNATVVVLLDQLDAIRKNPNFGQQLADAIIVKANSGNREDHQYIAGQTQVIEVHHADNQVVVTVGGNTGRVLGYGGGYSANDDDIIKWLNSDRLRRNREAKS